MDQNIRMYECLTFLTSISIEKIALLFVNLKNKRMNFNK